MSNVPTLAMCRGDFNPFDRNVYDPDTLADGVRSQFPGNPYQGEFAPGCICFITSGRQNAHSSRWNTLYHGFHTKLEKRYSQDMTYTVSYQWSNAIGAIRAIPGSGGSPGESARLVLVMLDSPANAATTPPTGAIALSAAVDWRTRSSAAIARTWSRVNQSTRPIKPRQAGGKRTPSRRMGHTPSAIPARASRRARAGRMGLFGLQAVPP